MESFFNEVQKIMEEDLKGGFNRIRILLNKTKKKTLKGIAYKIMNNQGDIYKYDVWKQWYEYILDMIDTKLFKPEYSVKNKKIPKNICVIPFRNKGMEDIGIQKILRDADVLECMPIEIRTEDHIPMISFKLGPTIRSNIFNYKETIEGIEIKNNMINIEECDCINSKFIDKNSGHIITGDLRIIENKKLRRLLSKGPNFREPTKKNFKKCKMAIEIALNECINTMENKYKITKNYFGPWK